MSEQVPGRQGLEAEASGETIRRITDNLARVVHAPYETLRLCVLCLVAEGHLIIEDFPGVGKTMLAKALARSLDVEFSRLQFTPDLLPSDVTGVNVFNQATNKFEFRPGPVFANVLLVDEINRAMPKTQSALLEAMAEHQVTIEGVTRPLAEPFLVLATENPIEQEGTFPLPEAQLDRFAIKTRLGYPNVDEELRIVEEQRHAHPLESLREAITSSELLEIREAAERVYVDRLVMRWLVELVRATRSLDIVSVGASVRASLALERAARAWALIHGRHFVEPADIEQLFTPIVAHRLVFEPFAVAVDEMAPDGSLLEQVWQRALALAPMPEPEWDRTAS